jgi:hypothetical protein
MSQEPFNESEYVISQLNSERPRGHGGETTGEYDYKTDVLYSPDEHPVLVHEYVHFQDHVSTPYGFFLDGLLEANNSGFARLFSLFDDDSAPSIPTPLASFLDDVDPIVDHLERHAKEGFDIPGCISSMVAFLQTWRFFFWLEKAMEGEELGGVAEDGKILGGAITLFEDLDVDNRLRMPETIDELTEAAANLDKWTVGEIQPEYTIEGDSEPLLLGGKGLLESRAFLAERSLRREDVTIDYLNRMREEGKHEYFLPVLVLFNVLQDMGGEHVGKANTTFMVLSDLALCTPIGDPYGWLRMSNSWMDVHPGCRFHRMLSLLPEIGPFESREEMNPFEYQTLFARELGWPLPVDMLKTGAHMEPRGYRGRRHKAMCAIKLEYPRLVHPGLGYLEDPAGPMQRFQEEFRPYEVVLTDDRHVHDVGGSDAATHAERLAEAYLRTVGRDHMQEEDVGDGPYLDSRFPYDQLLEMPDGQTVERFLREIFLSDPDH